MQEREEAYWELMEEIMEQEFMSNLMREETSDSPISCSLRPELMDCGAVDIEDFEEYENGYPQPDEDDELPF